jgi:spore coat polysaccharide biosynthesis protein SpsF
MILAIVQARMSSARLPGKVMAPILGEPMIVRLLERVRRAKTLGKILVATSTDPSDEPLAQLLTARGYPVFRGALNDVLARYAQAAGTAGEPTHVVRITADCPLIDPGLIDEAVRLAIASGAAYAGNTVRRTYPQGLEVEVVTTDALFTAAREATEVADRQQVTSFIRRNPERFAQAHLVQSVDQSSRDWKVDTCAGFTFARAVFEALHPEAPTFGMREVQDLLAARPDLNDAAPLRRAA